MIYYINELKGKVIIFIVYEIEVDKLQQSFPVKTNKTRMGIEGN